MKVSVIIPVYNVEPYVEACIKSVQAQSLENFEIICIEDAGQDGSKQIIEGLMREDPRISLYINEKNIGLAATRNRGLDLAKGRYVYFLDSDDMIRSDALESLYKKAEEEGLDACIFSADFLFEDAELEKKFGTNPAKYRGTYPEVMSGKDLYKAWMQVWDWMPSQPRYFYRRRFLEENGIRFIDGMLHEDETFAFDVLMHADRVRILDEAYFIRRFRAGSIMSGAQSMKNVISCIEILRHVSEYETEDEQLAEAIDFYKRKLLADTVKKYRTVRAGGEADLADGDLASSYERELLATIRKRRGLSLFACSSYYQILIALVIAMTQEISIDLVLEEHGIETAEELKTRLTRFVPDCVNKVFVCPTSDEVDPYEQKETAADEKLSKLLEKHMEVVLAEAEPLSEYEEINVFWDLGYTGTYLNIKQIPYTLHEDSLNSYQKIRENRKNYTYIFDEEKRREHRGVIPFGYSPWASCVEVNTLSGIQIPHDKVRARDREVMMQKLGHASRAQITKAFLKQAFDPGQTGTLLLTEPFYVTGRLPSEESQVRLYEGLIEAYGGEEQITIKAHPRDTLDYKKYFPHANVLEKNLPMEVLNFDDRICFETAVTVSSSVIYGMKNVKNKICLGADYLKNLR